MQEQRFIEIMDSTLRDGEQTSGVSFLPHEKLMIARMLLRDLNVDRIEVASARVSDGEKEAVKMICRYARQIDRLQSVEVLGFVDGHASVDWIVDAGACLADQAELRGGVKESLVYYHFIDDGHLRVADAFAGFLRGGGGIGNEFSEGCDFRHRGVAHRFGIKEYYFHDSTVLISGLEALLANIRFLSEKCYRSRTHLLIRRVCKATDMTIRARPAQNDHPTS